MLVVRHHRVEMKLDMTGRPYYVDHNTRTTSWTRPASLPPGYSELIAYTFFVVIFHIKLR